MKHTRGILKSLFAFAFLAAFCIPARADMFTSHDGRPMLIIAHRGANKFAPENTIPGIEKAIKMKLDFVEMDVRTTKDGQLVLMHDGSVERTTTGKGIIREMTLDEIRQLYAGIRFRPKFKGTRVPTFDEALAAAKGRINIYLDWKDADVEPMVKAIEAAGMTDQVLVLGDPMRLQMLRRAHPNIQIMVDMNSEKQAAMLLKSPLRFEALSPNMSGFTANMAKMAHEKGVKVFVDTLFGPIETCDFVRKMIADGADALQTDNPEVMVRCLDKIKKEAVGAK